MTSKSTDAQWLSVNLIGLTHFLTIVPCTIISDLKVALKLTQRNICSFQNHVKNNLPKDILTLDEFLTLRKEVVTTQTDDSSMGVVEGDEDAPPGVDDGPPGEDAAPPGEMAPPGESSATPVTKVRLTSMDI